MASHCTTRPSQCSGVSVSLWEANGLTLRWRLTFTLRYSTTLLLYYYILVITNLVTVTLLQILYFIT